MMVISPPSGPLTAKRVWRLSKYEQSKAKIDRATSWFGPVDRLNCVYWH